MSNDKLANEARQIIDGIRRHQVSSENKLSNVEKQVADLKTAVQKMTEAQEKPVVIEGQDDDLKKFIRKDGTLRLMTEKSSVNVAGYGMVNITEKGILDTDKNFSNWHKEFKDLCATKAFLKTLVTDTPKTDAKIIRHLESAPRFMQPVIQKSLYDSAGVGAEFVPDEFRDALYSQFVTPSRLADMFEKVPVERNTVLIPRLNYGGRPFKRGSVTSDTPHADAFRASTPQTAQASIAISGFATRYRVDMDLVEDSALPLISTLSQQIYNDLVDAEEDCIINGDTRNFAASQDPGRNNWDPRGRWAGGTFLDGSDHRQVFDGLRRYSTLKTTKYDINGALTAAKILEQMATLGEMAAQDLVLITSPEMFVDQILPLDQVLTLDKYGPAATILNGSLASIFGMPIVLSRYVDIKYNAGGGYDHVTTDRSGILIANMSSYKLYEKQGIAIETAREPASGAMEIVSTLRRVMNSPDQSTAKNVSWGYNTVTF